jgi:hypothetical protein
MCKPKGRVQSGTGLGMWFGNFYLVHYLGRKVHSLSFGYFLSLVMFPESFYLSKVTILGGDCVPMVG